QCPVGCGAERDRDRVRLAYIGVIERHAAERAGGLLVRDASRGGRAADRRRVVDGGGRDRGRAVAGRGDPVVQRDGQRSVYRLARDDLIGGGREDQGPHRRLRGGECDVVQRVNASA